MEVDTILLGDCRDLLPHLPDDSVDLIFTSPPYADNRKGAYHGIPIEGYVDWFLPVSEELRRVLKPDGSFVLNIKERAVNGERQTYVLELILAMKKQGWLWTEEYIWYKKNSYPGKWPNRFRDAWERCLHFTRNKKFKMFQEAVMVPMGSWKDKRLENLSDTDRTRHESRAESGLGRRVANWVNREKAYPTNVLNFEIDSPSNVLHMATQCSNRNHSATFPIKLSSWFVQLFTAENDVVLDPFIGSGTTALSCLETNRRFIGIEIEDKYYQLAVQTVAEHQIKLDFTGSAPERTSPNGRHNETLSEDPTFGTASSSAIPLMESLLDESLSRPSASHAVDH